MRMPFKILKGVRPQPNLAMTQTRERLIFLACAVFAVFAVLQGRLVWLGLSENDGPRYRQGVDM